MFATLPRQNEPKPCSAVTRVKQFTMPVYRGTSPEMIWVGLQGGGEVRFKAPVAQVFARSKRLLFKKETPFPKNIRSSCLRCGDAKKRPAVFSLRDGWTC